MTLLLTNDDGIEAPGIQVLEELIADLPYLVAAPRHPHSGCGHRVTAHQPIQVEAWSRDLSASPLLASPSDEEDASTTASSSVEQQRYAVHGTPADCTRLAIASLCDVPPHWVLSGINAGGNLGVDVYISGTVAAVREAAYQGIPGIAISQYQKGGQMPDWQTTGLWAAKVISQLLKKPPKTGCFWNVNLPWYSDVPTTNSSKIPELVFCEPSRDPLPLRYERSGNDYHYVGRYGDRAAKPGTDVAVCFGGGIAITHLSS